MSRKATLSILGLYQWDNTLFENMAIPSALSIDTLVDNLLAELAELEVLYSDPVLMKKLIGAWSNKMISVWNELYETTQYDYNPIENYNRMESGSSEGNKSTSNSGSDTSSESTINGGTDTSNESVINGGTDTNTRTATVNSAKREAGYDSTPSGNNDGLVDTEKNSNSGTSTDSVDYGQTVSRTGSLVHGQTVNKTGSLVHGHKIDSDEESEYTTHAHGNIGVTTTQKLIREQREISEFNVYSRIIDDFKNRFCIIVW